MSKPLSTSFNIAVLHITSKILPGGFDVSPHAPATFDELMTHYKRTGRVCVWDGASDLTIYGCREVAWAFRAWHDAKHIVGGFPFTRNGEFAAMKAQMADVRAIYDNDTADYFCKILYAEVMAQFDYKEKRGGFPINQRGFVEDYLERGRAALDGDYGVWREPESWSYTTNRRVA